MGLYYDVFLVCAAAKSRHSVANLKAGNVLADLFHNTNPFVTNGESLFKPLLFCHLIVGLCGVPAVKLGVAHAREGNLYQHFVFRIFWNRHFYDLCFARSADNHLSHHFFHSIESSVS